MVSADSDLVRRAPVKCLVVDDIDDNVMVLSALLRSDEVEVLTARSGPEALELLLKHDVALALLDVQMPEMDGFELAELMRGSERTRHVPLIFVTAGARDQYRMFKGYDAGAVDFLYKPIEPQILRSKADIFFQLHRQRQQLAQDLRERTDSLRLSEMFTAVLGHDLRNPLHAILTAAYLLQHQSDDPRVHHIASRIQSSGQRMERLIQDILDLARARLSGGIPLKPQRIDLGVIVEQLLREHANETASGRLVLESAGDLAGDGDGERLAQAVSNLISNALTYGSAGEPISIRIDGTSPETLTLSVRNGSDVPPEILPHIFDPFRGGERQPGRRDGLGLGLYIVDQIVKSHSGQITVESGAGHTVFQIMLPRHAPETLGAHQ